MDAIAGTVNIFRYGAGANGIMRTLGQYMLGSGTTFGLANPPRKLVAGRRAPLAVANGEFGSFFMGIGSVIRSDASPIVNEAYRRAHRRAFIMSPPAQAPKTE